MHELMGAFFISVFYKLQMSAKTVGNTKRKTKKFDQVKN